MMMGPRDARIGPRGISDVRRRHRQHRHRGPQRPHPQPEGRRLPHSARPGDGGHRALRRGQVVARLRHRVRRGAAALRRVDVDLCAAVPRPDGAAAGRRGAQRAAGGGAGGEERGAQRALDGRHDHRGLRRAAPPLRPSRRGGLPERPRPGGAPPAGGGGARRGGGRGGRALLAGGARGAAEEGRRRRAARAGAPGLPAPPRRGDGELVRLEPDARWPKALDPLPLVLGRFQAGSAAGRLAGTVEDAYRLGRGRVELHGARARRRGAPLRPRADLPGVRRDAAAADAGPLLLQLAARRLPHLPGLRPGDRHRPRAGGARPDAHPLQGAIAPWNTPAYEDLYDELHAAAKKRGVPLDVPWEELAEEDREWVWSGDGRFTNLDPFFGWLEHRTYKVHVRVLLARYRSYDRCPDCGGTRLQPEARAVTPRTAARCRSSPRLRSRTCAAGSASSRGRRASASSPATCWRSSASASRCCTASASTT